MSVVGEIGEFDVSGILQMLSLRHASGLLRLTIEGDEVAFYLKNGQLVHFESTHVPLRLGRVLQQRGLLSERQLEEALRMQVEGNHLQSLGEIVTARGWVTARNLADCHYEQQVSALSRAIAANRGMFAWHGGVAMPAQHSLFALDVERLLLDAVRRMEEVAALRAGLPGRHSVLAVSERVDVTITPFETAEHRIVEAIRAGISTWAELAEVLPLDERLILSTLKELIRRKLIVSGYAATTGDLIATGGPALDEDDLARLLGQPVRR